MKIQIIKLNVNSKIPNHATLASAGFDLSACIDHPVSLKPNETRMVPTGIAVAIPDGYFGMVCPRSGLAAKFGITITNAPGIVDSDYRGELICILSNLSKTEFVIENGMRIAQMIIMKYASEVEFEEVRTFTSSTERNTKGFGSTGM